MTLPKDHTASTHARYRRIPASLLRKLWDDRSMTTQQIADRVGLSDKALRKRILGLGLQLRGRSNRKLQASDRLLFAEMWCFGIIVDDIANYFSIAARTVAHERTKLGLTPRKHAVYPPMTLQAFLDLRAKRQRQAHELALARAMAATAQVEQRFIISAEMADKIGPHVVGAGGRA